MRLLLALHEGEVRAAILDEAVDLQIVIADYDIDTLTTIDPTVSRGKAAAILEDARWSVLDGAD